MMSAPTGAQRLALRERPTGRGPVMYQSWRQLLFLHWRVEPARIAPTLPAGLYVDTFEGHAYLGIVPFYMRNIRPRFFPAVPGISNFLELNLRTYVHDAAGRAGVWFYSLDASQWLAVQVARRFFRLPYFFARMHASESPDGTVDYHSYRRGTRAESASRFVYRGEGRLETAAPSTLAFFLVERYLLFAQQGTRLRSGRVHHAPYEIQPAAVTAWDTSVIALAGFPQITRPPDHALFSPGVDVDVFPLI